jgi:hypothetical protein
MEDVFFSYKDEIVNLGRIFCIQKNNYSSDYGIQLYTTGDCYTLYRFKTVEFRDKIWADIKKLLSEYSIVVESEVEGEEIKRVVPEIKNEKF